jgi:uncharacterized protein (DUF1015 family)
MEGGVRHTVWQVASQEATAMLTAQFDAMPALYIADGHHRSAAASRVAAARRALASPAGSASEYFLAVCFPHHQMRILPYNRVVRDLNGLGPEAFLQRLRVAFDVAPATAAVAPTRRGQFGLYVAQAWYRLEIRPDLMPADDPVGSLDVSLLTDQILAPILGIHDLRTDKRIDFVGGSRGTGALEQRVDSNDMAAAFSLHPTQMQDLMAVAERGQIMPPKSTWFEPKLADGLISHVLD